MNINSSQKGLTLIEMLIVLAMIGLIAAMMIVAIDPFEQFAKTRDASRKSTVGQLGHAVSSYVAATSGNFPSDSAFQTDLVQNGDIKTVINVPSYQTGANSCNPTSPDGEEGGFCYATDGSRAVVWVRLESKTEGGVAPSGNNVRCPLPAGWVAYWVYSTHWGSAGRVCGPSGAFTPDYDDVLDL